MADEQHSPTFAAGDLIHLAETFFLEFRVADGENLVDNQDFRLQKISRPFVFFDKQIEFAAGLAWQTNKALDFDSRRLLISFGVLDREAWLATITEDELRSFLWHP